MMSSILQQFSLHKRIFALAFPMVLSNITVPLLGLVDAAVIGHLEHAWYLGGVALGSTMVSVLFWLLGFLRMSTTGLTAQAWGAENQKNLVRVFLQGICFASFFSLLILIFHPLIASLVFSFSDASREVRQYGEVYFSVRIWSAPAALINLVIIGWLLGTQNAKKPMVLVLVVNSVNILLDLVFVLGLGLKVQGVAAASVLADYSGMLLGLYFVAKTWQQNTLSVQLIQLKKIFIGASRLVKLNRDIFLRSLCLQAAFSFMAFQAATLGDDIVAANVVLMNFLMLVSFAMDGFAYAIEALVGKAIGAKNKIALFESLRVTTFLSLFISFAITLVFGFFGTSLVNSITNIEAVRSVAYVYLPWLISLPLVSMWCFLLDGIFIGAARGRDMRNTMFIAMGSFFLIWWVATEFLSLGNHALWAAMTGFMLMRGLTLGWVFYRQWQQGDFFSERVA